MRTQNILKSGLLIGLVAATAGGLLAGLTSLALAAAPPMVAIATVPLTVVTPTHPQVIIAVGNSNSMDSSDNITDDGNVLLTSNAAQSAIMTWSGNPQTSNPSLQDATSPVNYVIPAGFTPPLGTGAAPAGQAPYNNLIANYSVTSPTGNGWVCIHSTLVPITSLGPIQTLPYPGNPPTGWPTPVLGLWSTALTATWYYNGVNVGGNNGYYSINPGPVTLRWNDNGERLASRSKLQVAGISALSPAAMLLGLSNMSYLVGSGSGGGASPRAVGGTPPPPPCTSHCPGPPPPTYCHEWQWIPPGTTVTPYTDYGDNAPSRLNIAKEAIGQVLNTFGGETDFGLMSYQVSARAGYYTWAYYMSQPGGFTFSNVYAAPSAGQQYVINPCYNATFAVNTDCHALSSSGGGPLPLTLAQLRSYKYMVVAARSDDPSINDVLLVNNGYFNGAPVFMAGGSITPPTPFPANFTVAQYNAGGVQLTYNNSWPQIGATGQVQTSPTNAGYVAYTPQVIYAQRGVLWAGNVSASSGNVRVPVSTAGVNPTPAQIATYVATFTPYLEPENNVPAADVVNYPIYNNAMFAAAGQSPIAGMLQTAAASFPVSAAPCPPQKYVILVTDGLPTMDLAGNSWPPLGSASAAGYSITASFNPDGSLNTTNNQALQDAISQLTSLQTAGVKTFVVGMGPGVDPSLNPAAAQALTAMAVAGGTGNYFAATSASAVVTDLNSILNLITKLNVSSVSGAVNTTGLNAGTVIYQASYTGYDTPYFDWTGDVQAFPVNAATGVVSTVATWSAKAQLDAQTLGTGWDTGRLIATWNPSTNTGVQFRWANISAVQQTELQPSDALGSIRLNYLRGDSSNEVHNAGPFRDRSHKLGDIVDSGTLYIGAANGPYTGMAGYQAFMTTTASRETMIYVGANDGMLHAFDAATGNEKFAFIPNGVFPNLINLTQTTYNNAHLFYVDGSPSAGDVKFASDGKWHTVLTGGLNDGGQSIYALDITNPSAITTEAGLASTVLWEYSDPTGNLGLTYSQPVIGLTADTASVNASPNGFLEFFGSGYNNNDGNDYLYAVNPETGKLVAKINLCAAVVGTCNAALPNGLSSPVVVNSAGNLGSPVDTLYAGDLQGNMWKVNISNASPAGWVVSLLFQAQDSLGNPQPITVTPVVSLHPDPADGGTIVYFGTGQYLGPPDITNTNTQSFYAVWDKPAAPTATRAQLQQQVITDVVSGTTTAAGGTTSVETRSITNNSVNWATQRGWFMDLPDTGERDITNPRLFNGEVVFATYAPTPSGACTVGGNSFLMAVNYTNGGSFPQPQLDINGDGLLNSGDQLAGGLNPVGIGLGNVFASAPTILSANLGAIHAVKLTTLSTGTIQSVGEAGGAGNRRLSWWQLQ
ncbi:MAG: PilC/PilY family type IV pilus protein [Gammaproteobacteria bacterium]